MDAKKLKELATDLDALERAAVVLEKADCIVISHIGLQTEQSVRLDAIGDFLVALKDLIGKALPPKIRHLKNEIRLLMEAKDE